MNYSRRFEYEFFASCQFPSYNFPAFENHHHQAPLNFFLVSLMSHAASNTKTNSLWKKVVDGGFFPSFKMWRRYAALFLAFAWKLEYDRMEELNAFIFQRLPSVSLHSLRVFENELVFVMVIKCYIGFCSYLRISVIVSFRVLMCFIKENFALFLHFRGEQFFNNCLEKNIVDFHWINNHLQFVKALIYEV